MAWRDVQARVGPASCDLAPGAALARTLLTASIGALFASGCDVDSSDP
jgi:hypothetical protein